MLGIEHLLFLFTTFAFPPVALTVLLCIILATFGKSLGLRQMYVDTLIHIFEVRFIVFRFAENKNEDQKWSR
ncbi:hypothetical protein B9Z55_023764 [Caenorhabditis nigoni]|uniref:Uncharacterized protein n=1 Tax=Caenorhabditis nigoni TaxID=1611254 RepID=A0A2G5SRL2_9PELO|nr:hypothetical protein B9Z55_023764 [Caenorhabditis nigoni]